MKATLIIGIILIIIGILAFIAPNFNFTTHHEKTADLGPIHLQANVPEEHSIHLPQALGIIGLVGGIILVVVGTRKSS